jgi:hypothetical protein
MIAIREVKPIIAGSDRRGDKKFMICMSVFLNKLAMQTNRGYMYLI